MILVLGAGRAVWFFGGHFLITERIHDAAVLQKNVQLFLPSVKTISHSRVGDGWQGDARVFGVTRLATRPHHGEAHRGATIECMP